MTNIHNKRLEQEAANDMVPPELKNPQIFDLKLMADMEHSYKCKAREALSSYRCWQKFQARQTDKIMQFYGTMEGRMLRRQAADACAFYWVIRRDLRRSLRQYLKQSGCSAA